MTWHANATSIHKGAYIQSSDPGAVGAKVLWFDTTSGFVLKKRNDANSGWDTIADLGGIASSGDVDGPASSTDNALARFDGTTGKLIQNSVVVVSDAGTITVPEIAAPSTPASGTVHIYAKADGKLYIKDDAGTETDLTTATANIAPLVIEDANTVAQRNSTANQNFNVYRNYNSPTDHQRIRVGWTGTTAEIMSEAQTQGASNLVFKVGSGVSLNLGSASLAPSTDNTFTLGGSGAYFSEIYNNSYVGKSGGNIRMAGAFRFTGPAAGIVNIKDDVPNTGSGTFRFDSRNFLFTSDQNDFNQIAAGYFLRWSGDAARAITGLTFSNSGLGDGQVHLILNDGAFNITLKHEDTNSTAANRFKCSGGADIVLAPDQAADLIYDSNISRWRVFKRN